MPRQPRLLDVSVLLKPGMPVYPGNPDFECTPVSRIADGRNSNYSKLVMGTHTGTHVDAPLHFLPGTESITDLPLEADGPSTSGHDVVIDNFSFAPAAATVPVGTTITWVNHDDVPHVVMSTEKKFKSPVLDTDEKFSYSFDASGTYEYFCSLHPRMTGRIVVA